MRKWHVVTLSIVAVIALLVVGGYVFYQYYIVPEYLVPVMEKVRDYVNDDEVLDELYDQAIKYHEDGVIQEDTFAKFVEAYEKRTRDDESFAREILEAKDNEDYDESAEPTSISAKYASNKVGVETIQTNNSNSGGTSTKRYSEERTSDRIKAEDIVEAEKVIYEKENEDKEKSEKEEEKETAYAILKANMTSEEFNIFVEIMRKLDTDVLLSYVDTENKNLKDKAGLKEYMHSCLTNSEYKAIVNLGYKYVYLFIEK